MKNSMQNILKDVVSISLLTALLLYPIAALTHADSPTPLWAQQILTLRDNLKLSPQQTQVLTTLLSKREQSLRHLKSQMLTTLTPEQKITANSLLVSHQTGHLAPQERLALRQQLKISKAQAAQLDAYHYKIDELKKSLAQEIKLCLTPAQRPHFQDLAMEF